MNFQTIRQIKGQKDGNYPKKLDMFGTLNEIGGVYFNQNQTPCSKCVITDDLGEKHKVIIMKDVPATNLLNTRQGFSLYAYDGNYQGKEYIGYSGFWVANPRQVPQNAQQAPQQALQSTNPPNMGNYTQILERIATAIEKLAGQSFEEKYKLGQDPDFPNEPEAAQADDDCPF